MNQSAPPQRMLLATIRALITGDLDRATGLSASLSEVDRPQLERAMNALTVFMEQNLEPGFAARLRHTFDRWQPAPAPTQTSLPVIPKLGEHVRDQAPQEPSYLATQHPDAQRRAREGDRTLRRVSNEGKQIITQEDLPSPTPPRTSHEILTSDASATSAGSAKPGDDRWRDAEQQIDWTAMSSHFNQLLYATQSHGDPHAEQHAKIASLTYLRLLPPELPERYLARSPAIYELTEKLRQYGWLVFTGLPGSGKSILALQLAIEARRDEKTYPGGVIVTDLADMSGREPAEAILEAWKQALRDESAPGVSLARALAEQGQTLVVLDNADKRHEMLIGQICRIIPNVTRLLITTRQRSIARKHDLQWYPAEGATGFTLEETSAFLSRQLKVSGEELQPWLASLHDAIHGHPMMLEIVARLLRGSPPEAWEAQVQAFITDLSEGNDLGGPLSIVDDSHQDIERVFLKSYHTLGTLQRPFRLLGMLAPNASVSAPLASALWGCSAKQAQQWLDQLVDASMLQVDEQARGYTIHPIPHYTAWKLLDATPDEWHQAALDCIAWHSQALREGKPQLAHLTRTLDLAIRSHPEQALELLERCATFFSGTEMTWWICDWADRLLVCPPITAREATALRALTIIANSLPDPLETVSVGWQKRLERIYAYPTDLSAQHPDLAPAVAVRLDVVKLLATHLLLMIVPPSEQHALFHEVCAIADALGPRLEPGDQMYALVKLVHVLDYWGLLQFKGEPNDQALQALIHICDQALLLNSEQANAVLVLRSIRTLTLLALLHNGADQALQNLNSELPNLAAALEREPEDAPNSIVVLATFTYIAGAVAAQTLEDDSSVAQLRSVESWCIRLRKQSELALGDDPASAIIFTSWAWLFQTVALLRRSELEQQPLESWATEALRYLGTVIDTLSPDISREGVILAHRLRRDILVARSKAAPAPRDDALVLAVDDARQMLALLDRARERDAYADALQERLAVLTLLPDISLTDPAFWIEEACDAVDDAIDFLSEDPSPDSVNTMITLRTTRATLLFEWATEEWAIESHGTDKLQVLRDANITAHDALRDWPEGADQQARYQLLTICAATSLILALIPGEDRRERLVSAWNDTWALYEYAQQAEMAEVQTDTQELLEALRNILGESFEGMWREQHTGEIPAWLRHTSEQGRRMIFMFETLYVTILFAQAVASQSRENWSKTVQATDALRTYPPEARGDITESDLVNLRMRAGVGLARTLLAENEQRLSIREFTTTANVCAINRFPLEHCTVWYCRALGLAYVAQQPRQPEIRSAFQEALATTREAERYITDNYEQIINLLCLRADMINQLLMFEEDPRGYVPLLDGIAQHLEQVPLYSETELYASAQRTRAMILHLLSGLPGQNSRARLHAMHDVCDSAIQELGPEAEAAPLQLLRALCHYDLALELGEDRDQHIGTALRDAWDVIKARAGDNSGLVDECWLLLTAIRFEYAPHFGRLWIEYLDNVPRPTELEYPAPEIFARAVSQTDSRFFALGLLAPQATSVAKGWHRAAQAGERLLPVLGDIDESLISTQTADVKHAYEQLADAHFAERSWEPAHYAYQRAQAIEPDAGKPYLNDIMLLDTLGRRDEAWHLCQQLRIIDPQMALQAEERLRHT